MSYIPEVEDREITDEWNKAFLEGYNAALEEIETARANMESKAEVDDITEDNHIETFEKIISEISEKAIDACILRLQLTLKAIRCSMVDEEMCNKEQK